MSTTYVKYNISMSVGGLKSLRREIIIIITSIRLIVLDYAYVNFTKCGVGGIRVFKI